MKPPNTFHNLPHWIRHLFRPRQPQTSLTINAFRLNDYWYFHRAPITLFEGLHAVELLDRLGKGAKRLQIELDTNEQSTDQGWFIIEREALDET